jgi:hypothetical protein
MGHHPNLKKPCKGQPLGSYEDLDMNRITRKLINGEVTTAEWLEKFGIHGIFSSCRPPRIGCKVTHLAALTPKQLIEINPLLVVRTYRPKPLTLASLKLYRGVKEDWSEFYDLREQSMDILEAETNIPFHTVDFDSNRRSDEEIKEELESVLNWC